MILLTCFATFLAIFLLFTAAFPQRSLEAKVFLHRMRSLRSEAEKPVPIRIEKKERFSDLSFYDRLLKKIRPIESLRIFIQQSGVSLSAGAVLLISAVWGGGTFLLIATSAFSIPPIVALFIVSGVATLPFAFLAFKRKQRFKRFSEAFPEAVSRISSSLRAGLSLQMAFEVVAEDRDTVVAKEFNLVVSQLEVGQSFEGALRKMLERMDTPELRLFISLVLLQSESGGNLAQLLDNLEMTVRERFELRRELDAASAQAKLSGLVLSFLPIFVGIFISLIHRDYVLFFFDDPLGKILLGISVMGQLIGFLTIQKIVRIDY